MKKYHHAELAAVLKPFLVEGEQELDRARSAATPPHISDLAWHMLKADGGDDRSRHAARVVERLHHEGYDLDYAISLIRDQGGSWKDRYSSGREFEKDMRRLWKKHAVPKDAQREANARSAAVFARGQVQPQPDKLITASPFVPVDPATVPKRETLFGGHYNRKFFSATFGVGGGGKSALAIVECVSIATGTPILWYHPVKPLKVWYFNLEDPPDELQRRFVAVAIHYGIDQKLLAENLFVDSGRTQQFVIVEQQGRDTVVVTVLEEAIIEEMRSRKIDLLILDPLASVHHGDENSNPHMQQLATALTRIADRANAAVEGVHHVNKSSGDGRLEVTAESGRGAGALKDKARSVRAINTMSEKEAEKAGIESANRFSYFRVTNAKSNMSKRSGHADWYRIVSVDLGNGTKWTPGDSVGVVEKWEWPSDTTVADDISVEQLAEIKRRISLNPHGADHQSKDWAGRVFGDVLGLNTKADKPKIRKIMRALVDAGQFSIVRRNTTKKGRERPMFEAEPEPHHRNGGVGSGDS
jgi:hypothetical protein